MSNEQIRICPSKLKRIQFGSEIRHGIGRTEKCRSVFPHPDKVIGKLKDVEKASRNDHPHEPTRGIIVGVPELNGPCPFSETALNHWNEVFYGLSALVIHRSFGSPKHPRRKLSVCEIREQNFLLSLNVGHLRIRH